MIYYSYTRTSCTSKDFLSIAYLQSWLVLYLRKDDEPCFIVSWSFLNFEYFSNFESLKSFIVLLRGISCTIIIDTTLYMSTSAHCMPKHNRVIHGLLKERKGIPHCYKKGMNRKEQYRTRTLHRVTSFLKFYVFCNRR